MFIFPISSIRLVIALLTRSSERENRDREEIIIFPMSETWDFGHALVIWFFFTVLLRCNWYTINSPNLRCITRQV